MSASGGLEEGRVVDFAEEERESELLTGKMQKVFKLFSGLMLVLILILVIIHLPLGAGSVFDVINHNLENDIDATPLFYSEVENIYQISHDVGEMHKSAVEKSKPLTTKK